MVQSTLLNCSILLTILREVRQQLYKLCILPDVKLHVGQGLCYIIHGEGDGFQYQQKTHCTEDIAVLEDAGDILRGSTLSQFKGVDAFALLFNL